MGFGERELMLRVELPLAMPVILTGVRIAAVQVIATEPLVAFFGGDGLGVYLRQGLGNQDFHQVQAGALLVTATAIGIDFLLYLAGRAVLPKGVQRSAVRPRRPAGEAPVPHPQIKEPTRCEPPDGDSSLALLVPLALLVACLRRRQERRQQRQRQRQRERHHARASDTTIRIVPQDFPESQTLTEAYALFLESQGLQGRGAGRQRLPRDRLPGARRRQGRPDHRLHRQRRQLPRQDRHALVRRGGDLHPAENSIGDKPIQALDYSPAEDKNALVALKSFAEENDLETISDLKAIETRSPSAPRRSA